MKHLTTILAAVLLALLALTLTGCEDYRQDKSESEVSRNLCSERIIRFEHNYLYFYDRNGGYDPVNVIHYPDCPCHKNNPELLNEK